LLVKGENQKRGACTDLTIDGNPLVREGGKEGRRQNVFTILPDNIKQLNTYNIALSNYAQISTSLEIVCVAVERWLVLPFPNNCFEFGGVVFRWS